MSMRSRGVVCVSRRAIAIFAAAAASIWLTLSPDRADAQSPSIMVTGDAVVTGFSGVAPAVPPFPSGNPLDETFIDLNGASMRIQRLQPNAPPQGQVIAAPTIFSAPASAIGQVFAVTMDDYPAPNIYLGASSVYGLQIVIPDNDGDGRPERVKTGQPGAQWMAGQWGPGGSPGSIWRVDGTTGAITLFTTIGANAGPGLGDVVYDRATHQYFVSDLDTGLIYRLDWTGLITDTFDHGTTGRPNMGLPPVADDGSFMDITSPAFDSENPATWGYTQPERMVWGLAMYAGRLYYSVFGATPQIWSVSINLDGTFGNDPRWELDVNSPAGNNPVSDILFDNLGRMVVAQRGAQRGSYDYTVFAEPLQSSVLRFRREIPDDPTTPGTWVPVPEEYAIGFRPEERNTTGGISLGYGYDQSGQLRRGACNEYLWTTGESLRDNPALAAQLVAGGPAIVHGLQGNDRDLVRPANDPPFESYFADYDGLFADPGNQGHMGDVEVWQPCQGGTGIYVPPYFPPPNYPPPQPGTFNLTLDKAAEPYECLPGGLGWLCYYTVRVTNTGTIPYWGPITVDDWLPTNPPGANVYFDFQPPWFCALLGAAFYECSYPPVPLFPGESVDLYVTVELPAAVAANHCYLPNAAQIRWPLGFGDANPADNFDWDSAKVPDAACPPPQGNQTNLTIEKDFYPDCWQDGTNWLCAFLVTITNTLPGGVYNGPLEFSDTVSSGTITDFGPAPWTCLAAGPGFTCSRPPVVLNPGESELMYVVTSTPAADLEAADACEIRNDVHITEAPGGSPHNINPGDDDSSATALVPAEHCQPQETDLSIVKEPSDFCIYDEFNDQPGFYCDFDVTVTNESPTNNFSGQVTVHDVLSFTPPVEPFFSPGWTCGADGGGYSCTSDPTVMFPGWTVHLGVGFFVPDDGEVCQVANTATITDPPGGSLQNTNPANDASPAVVINIPSEQCHPVQVLMEQQICPLERRTPDGGCCPEGEPWNGRSCGAPKEAAPPPPPPPPPPPENQCPAGSVGTPPDCNCPQGTTGTPPNCTAPQCPAGSVGTPPDCRCPQGTTGTPPNCAPVRACPAERQIPGGGCCQPGTVWNSQIHSCGPPPPTSSCPKERQIPGDGCCRSGTTWNGLTCAAPQPTCPKDRQIPGGGCCQAGTKWNGLSCSSGGGGTTTQPQRCPEGTIGSPPFCLPIPKCPEGTTGTFPNCHKIPTEICTGGKVGTPPNCRCPRGTKEVNGQCVTQPSTNVPSTNVPSEVSPGGQTTTPTGPSGPTAQPFNPGIILRQLAPDLQQQLK